MDKQALDYFGEMIVRKVRDTAIDEWDDTIDGKMKSGRAQRVRESLSDFGAERLGILHWLVPQIVDTTLHHLLWTLEQEARVEVAVRTPSSVVPNLRDASDGLAGDLYGDRGWIARFSSKPRVDT